MYYNNPLGDAEDILHTPLLKGEGTAICVSLRDDFTPLSSIYCQWVCRCRQVPGGCHVAASDVLLFWKLLARSLICLV